VKEPGDHFVQKEVDKTIDALQSPTAESIEQLTEALQRPHPLEYTPNVTMSHSLADNPLIADENNPLNLLNPPHLEMTESSLQSLPNEQRESSQFKDNQSEKGGPHQSQRLTKGMFQGTCFHDEEFSLRTREGVHCGIHDSNHKQPRHIDV
jgi:hypothetical protein